MRVFSAVLIFTFIFSTEEIPQISPETLASLKANITACQNETGADLAVVRSIWTTPDAPADNEPAKCFYKCMLLKAQMIDGTEKINKANLVLFAGGDPEDIKEIGDECDDIKVEADSCEFGYQITKCVALTKLD